jgi:glycosyl hydrolase family 8
MQSIKVQCVPVTLLLITWFVFPVSLAVNCAYAQSAASPARSFPQHIAYHKGTILPDHITRAQLDDQVRSFYTAWKLHYIREGCGNAESYIWFESDEEHNKQCVSEGQGYGMLIVALMAGYDSAAHTIFDGLFRYYHSHPSKADPHLMAWAQKKGCRDIDGSSATDGDMDIAWSLLLADAQWGNDGPIHYRDEGRHIISSILKQEINPKTFSILLSNSVEHDSKDYFDMRSSDFMPAHFHVFKAISGDPGWDIVIDNNYRLFSFLQKTYSPEAGLLPDFINKISIRAVNSGSGHTATARPGLAGEDQLLSASPAPPHYLESRYDGSYNFNACRVPWRIATDYLMNGDQRALAIVEKINRWVRSTTGDNPDNISAGYSLGGDDLKNRNYEALCFIGSFAISAMVGRNNQPWLNKLWDYIVQFPLKQFDYYDNSIKMIDLIVLSGNYWAPNVP